MDVHRFKVQVTKHQCKLETLVTSRSKDYHLFASKLGEKKDKVSFFVFGRSKQVVLFESVDRFVPCVHFNLNWIIKRSSLEFLHFGGHGCGKQECVSFFWDLGENQIDLFFEVH